MHNKRTTAAHPRQFTTHATALNKHTTWNKPDTRPRTLSLNQALKTTLLTLRQNCTEELLAELFNISQPTISRTINTLEQALEKALSPMVNSLEESLTIPGSLVIDGTLVPAWNWASQGKILFSGKHHRAGFNHQVISTLHGKLLAITDPVPRG